MTIEELISTGEMSAIRQREILLKDDSSLRLLLNPHNVKCTIADNSSARIVVVYTKPTQSGAEFMVGRGATLSLVELYLSNVLSQTAIRQETDSRLKLVEVVLEGASAATTVELSGEHIESEVDALFMAMGSEHCCIDINMRHLKPQCKSRSLVKGVATDRATGEFRGMVYVAQDAQQTDAEQQCKNIELGQSRINAMPQLEIYADDVRCSHGATVGKSDEEALFYMRQRGLSESAARRLQVEGFINDIIERCDFESIRTLIEAEVSKRLERL